MRCGLWLLGEDEMGMTYLRGVCVQSQRLECLAEMHRKRHTLPILAV